MMTVQELKELLRNLPDDAEVIIWDEEEAHSVVSGHTSEDGQTPAVHLDIYER